MFITLTEFLVICRNLADRLKSPFPSSNSSLPPPESTGVNPIPSGITPGSENLNYSESYIQDFRIPSCYTMSKPKDLPESMIKDFPVNVLFYMFYNMPNDRA